MPRRASASPAPPPEACVARGRAFPGVPRRFWRAGPRSPLRVAASRPRPPGACRPGFRSGSMLRAPVRGSRALPAAARPVPAPPSAARASVLLRLCPRPRLPLRMLPGRRPCGPWLSARRIASPQTRGRVPSARRGRVVAPAAVSPPPAALASPQPRGRTPPPTAVVSPPPPRPCSRRPRPPGFARREWVRPALLFTPVPGFRLGPQALRRVTKTTPVVRRKQKVGLEIF